MTMKCLGLCSLLALGLSAAQARAAVCTISVSDSVPTSVRDALEENEYVIAPQGRFTLNLHAGTEFITSSKVIIAEIRGQQVINGKEVSVQLARKSRLAALVFNEDRAYANMVGALPTCPKLLERNPDIK